MNSIIESERNSNYKLNMLLRIKQLNNNLLKSVNVLNELKDKSIDNKINNNLVKMFRISVECNAFDENEDKQRQCYKQFICFWPKCRFSAKNENKLNQHISQHLNKRQFVCNQCNKVFIQLSHLNQHKRCVHSNVRPFVCRRIDCNKRFKTKTNLNLHKRIHSTEKPYKCTECDKRFTYSSDLSKHKLIHSGIKAFKCNVNDCGKRFRKKVHLNEHINRHNGIKRYKCFHNNCDKSFVTSYELKSHINHIHSNEKLFKCSVNECNRYFKPKVTLNQHIKDLH